MTTQQSDNEVSVRTARVEVLLKAQSNEIYALRRVIEEKRNDQDALAESFRNSLASVEAMFRNEIKELNKTVSTHETRIGQIWAVGLIFLMGFSTMIGAKVIRIGWESSNDPPPQVRIVE